MEGRKKKKKRKKRVGKISNEQCHDSSPMIND